MTDTKTPYRFVVPLMVLYVGLSLIGLFHHEIYLEEAQQLTIGRDSNSILDVSGNMLYEGHATLWNTLLFFIAHYISAQPVYMQLFHLLVISCAVFIFLRHAPFTFPVKTLVVFGCYFFYVYSIITRNYALGILLLFICCTLMANPVRNMVAISFILVLLCFTHLLYVFASVGIFLYMLVFTIGKKELYKKFILFSCIFFIALVCAYIQAERLPGDSIIHHSKGLEWINWHSITFAVKCFTRGYITFPPLHQPYFWDKQDIQQLPDAITLGIALLLFAATITGIYKSRKALVFYLASVLLLTYFFASSGMGGSRYFGMYFIFFIVALWLASYDGVMIFTEKDRASQKPVAHFITYFILAIQFITGAFMYQKDFTDPFSQAKNTVDYIKTNHLDTQPMAVDGYNAGPPISAYLGKKIYYLDIGEYGSFCWWKSKYLPYPRRVLMQEIINSAYINSFGAFILICNRRDELDNSSAYNFRKLASFEGAEIEGEDYYVYQAIKKSNQ